MSTWVIISWIAVGLLTAINVFIFLKLKSAADQMLKMAFPNSKGMGDAMAQMQKMMGGMGGLAGMAGGKPGFGGKPALGGKGGPSDAQVKAAMDMLSKMQKK